MGERALLAAAGLILAGALAAGAAAQGMATREHWNYLHVEARRAEVRRELAGRDDTDRAVVARVLAKPKPDDGVPFARLADALAYLRGVDADAAFMLRAAMGAFVLPEVCDPTAANEACRDAHVSPFLGYALPFPAKVAFEVEVRDAAGAVVWTGAIREHTEERDVRMARPTTAVPGAALADGAYTATVRTRIGEAAPAATDPCVCWTFHVLRGYQARAEAALGALGKRAARGGDDDAVLRGLAERVQSAYAGEPCLGQSDAVADLQRLERALANVDAGRPAADGCDGDLAVAIPVGGAASLVAVLRRVRANGPRPLVVVAAGAPTLDGRSDRPALPVVRAPGWTAREWPEFGRGDDWNVAFVASPGGGVDYAAALTAALPWLVRHCGAAADAVVLVAEREAATVAAFALPRLRPMVAAACFVDGGALMAATAAAADGLPLAYVRSDGFGGGAVDRSLEFVAARQAQRLPAPRTEALPAALAAWPFGLSGSAVAIADFVRRALAR
jgi:hypothetical protein